METGVGTSKDQPTVAVVIPTSGQRPFLNSAIRCAMAQRDVEVSVIVVADGPKAKVNCAEWVIKGENVRLLALAERAGASAARNLGLRESDSEFVFFLDDDDLVHPTMLRTCIDSLERANASLGVCATVAFESDKSLVSDTLFRPPASGHRERFLRHDIAWMPCGCVYRRDAPGLADGWKEDLPKNQDFHMHAKCLVMGARAAATPEILAFWRQHGGSRLSVASTAVDAVSGFDVLEDLRRRLEWQGTIDDKDKQALALGYLQYMTALGGSGERTRCREARQIAADLSRPLSFAERWRLLLYEVACRRRPSAAWRLLSGTRLDPVSRLNTRRLAEADREAAQRALAETLAAIAPNSPQ